MPGELLFCAPHLGKRWPNEPGKLREIGIDMENPGKLL